MEFSRKLRVRRRGLRTGLAAAAVMVVAGAAAVAQWPHAWWWLTVLTAGIAAGCAIVLPALIADVERRAVAAKTADKAVQWSIDGKPPLVKDSADLLAARVNRAVLPIPYIERDVESQARSYLMAGRPVLLVGSSMVGKTQMAVNMIGAFADRRLVMPDSMDALAQLEAADRSPQEAVIFLDAIDRLIGPGGITDGALLRLGKMGNAIVGTIRAREYSRFHPNDQFAYCQWDVLKQFERVFLNSKLSEPEKARLQAVVSDSKIRQRIIRVGIGEYVGAAELIEEALRLGPSVSPIGYALVQGAADWRCVGIRTPVLESLLPALAEPHLSARNRLELCNRRAYKAALQWATRDINPSVALLQHEASGSFSIFDYALDLLSQGDERIPDITWQIAIQNAEPDDLISVGYTAEVIYSKSDVALKAWQSAADSGQADQASMATCNIMTYHQNHGNENAAEIACRRVMDSGHTDHAPMAAVNLGILLQQGGDLVGAREAYQRAIDSRHPSHAPRAWLGMGGLLEKEGDVRGARIAYQNAAQSKHTDTAEKAQLRLRALKATEPM